MADVTMPQLGETVTEGTVTKWFKKVGDTVAEDETLFEVSTDKVDSEVPSSAAGYVAEILVQEGETVDVGARLAVITEESPSGDDGDEPEAAAEADSDLPEPEEQADSEQVAPQPEAEPGPVAQSEDGAESDADPEPQGEAEAGPEPTGPRRVLSPVVRRLLSENDLDPADIEGTGKGGPHHPGRRARLPRPRCRRRPGPGTVGARPPPAPGNRSRSGGRARRRRPAEG